MPSANVSPTWRADNKTAHVLFSIACVATSAWLFYGPARAACGGEFPAPLDDVFIHFDFARALCHGHPFEWIAGQGFSSGETSPLYAVVLAAGYAIGFRGMSLAIWAAMIACGSLVWAMASLRQLAPRASSYVGAALLVSVGALDFSLFSGMEIAFFVALVLQTLVRTKRLVHAEPWMRSARQWRLGWMGVWLVWTRPEAAVLVLVLAVFAARHAHRSSPIAALVRVGTPGAVATLLVLAMNYVATGDYASAGARLKLLSSNPYLSDLDRARELALNVLHFKWRVLEGSVAATPSLLALPLACAAVGLFVRATRGLTAVALVSASLYALLVSFNGAARFQGFRYYAPAVALLLVAVTLGVSAIERKLGSALAVLIGLALVGGAASRMTPQRHFFRDASKNIHDQQVAVGRMLRRIAGPGESVLVGDAGAIPYFSELGAIDALGLGGYRELPFVSAALSGESSTVELLQRIPMRERPSLLALYPNWFPGITTSFGHEIAHVTIDNNVICGGPTKGIYRADWSALDVRDDPPGAITDELDVADVTSEHEHAYVSPAPRGGFAIFSVRPASDGRPMFDAGRIIPAGEEERFVAHADAQRVWLVMRSDAAVDADVSVQAAASSLHSPAPRDGWMYPTAGPFTVHDGDVIVLRARVYVRDFHVWLITR